MKSFARFHKTKPITKTLSLSPEYKQWNSAIIKKYNLNKKNNYRELQKIVKDKKLLDLALEYICQENIYSYKKELQKDEDEIDKATRQIIRWEENNIKKYHQVLLEITILRNSIFNISHHFNTSIKNNLLYGIHGRVNITQFLPKITLSNTTKLKNTFEDLYNYEPYLEIRIYADTDIKDIKKMQLNKYKKALLDDRHKYIKDIDHSDDIDEDFFYYYLRKMGHSNKDANKKISKNIDWYLDSQTLSRTAKKIGLIKTKKAKDVKNKK
jgi:hypothetical protein